MRAIVKLFLYGVAVLITAYLLPGVNVENFWIALVVAVVLMALNTFVKPIISILTFPINFLTLGLFGFIVNIVIVLITDWIVPGFALENFLWAALFSIVLSVIKTVFDMLDGSDK